MTQTERVLAALRNHPRGITAVDFLLPNVIDGGTPITRVARCVGELRDAGHRIDNIGRRDKCVVYKLLRHAGAEGNQQAERGDGAGRAPRATPVLDTTAATGQLFDPAITSRPAGAYDDLEAA